MGTPADIPARAEAAAALDVDLDPAAVVDANDLRDTTGEIDTAPAGPRGELPLEADPADVAEQDAAVPYDDEER
jgi:hypothetical protein